MQGIVYLVGTPIGNLGDMTFRAVETLEKVDIIACEDTRHSLALLNYYEIKKPLISCHQHNEKQSVDRLASLLEEGKNIAIITDAGMPAISDPGAIVVNELFERGYNIQVVPSATAVTSAMALSGIVHPIWTFIGFLPTKTKDKTTLVQPFVNVPTSLVFYCSPHAINKDLQFLATILSDRKVHIIKEITKMHERHEIYDLQNCQIEEPRGEYVVIVEAGEQQKQESNMTINEQVRLLMQQGLDKKNAIKQVAKDNNLAKDDVYKQALDI